MARAKHSNRKRGRAKKPRGLIDRVRSMLSEGSDRNTMDAVDAMQTGIDAANKRKR